MDRQGTTLLEALYGDERKEDLVLEDEILCMVENIRDKQILIFRFRKGLTYAKIGEKIGVTRERVRQIISRAFRKLRQSIKVRQLVKRIG